METVQTVQTINAYKRAKFSIPEKSQYSIIFIIITCISWLLLLVSGWISLKWLEDDDYMMIWTIYIERGYENYYYLPFQMHVSIAYIVFIFSLVMILVQCILYFYKTIFKRDDNVINGILGPITKFHFIPLLFVSALFIIGESYSKQKYFHENFKSMVISGFIFSLLGLISMIFIYIKIDLRNNSWWEQFILKKSAFSCLIVLLWYYFLYNIYYIRKADKSDDTYEEMWNWKRGCGLFASIAFGIGSNVFAIIFKDLMICLMTMIIYLGLLIYYFKIPNYFRKIKYLNKQADGVIDGVFCAVSLTTFGILFVKRRDECFNKKV